MFFFLFQKKWSFNSQLLCDAYISVDQISCTASIVHLCMISVDRYLAISKPFSYERYRTYKYMAGLIAIAWTIAIMVPLPPLIFFGNENIFETGQCQISQNKIYTIYSCFTAFYLPLSVMCVVYFRLYRSANEINRNTKRLCNPSCRVTNEESGRVQSQSTKSDTQSSKGTRNDNTSPSGPKKTSNRAHYRNETKAARTLGVIMGAFCVCWVPFFVVSTLRPFMEVSFPKTLDSVLLWLGYSNSCLNPIIYGLFNKEFRTPYYFILCCKLKNINRRCNIALNPLITRSNLENELNLPNDSKFSPSRFRRTPSMSLSNLKINEGHNSTNSTNDIKGASFQLRPKFSNQLTIPKQLPKSIFGSKQMEEKHVSMNALPDSGSHNLTKPLTVHSVVA